MYQPDDHPEAEFREDVDEKVKNFTREICEWIYERFPNKDIEVDEELIVDAAGEYKANRMSVRTDLGLVMILPDFTSSERKPTAAAMVINLGIARAMHLEGFELDYIEREGRIYSNPIPYTPSSVEVLGYYLTHKVTTTV